MQSVTRIPALGVISLAFLALAAGSPVAAATEDEAVRAAALDYAEGWHTGDEERVARALHPDMLRQRVVREVLGDAEIVRVMDAAAVIRATRDGVGKGIDGSLMSLRVAILERHGNMAVARVVSPLYVDYLQMVRWQGRWVVLSVLWGTVAAPGE
jgi:hypothetical protein